MPTCSRSWRIWSRLRRVRCPPVNRMPETSIEPSVGSSMKFTQRSTVDFPEPERPKITTTSPRWTSRSTPRTTSRWPKLLCSPSMRTTTSRRSGSHRRRHPCAASVRLAQLDAHGAGDVGPVVAPADPSLQPGLEEREEDGEPPVDERRGDVRLEVLEVGLADQLGAAEDLGARGGHAEEGDQRGVLHHRDELVAGRRDDHPERLRQHDLAHLLAVGHAERVGGLALAAGHRLDARAEDLGHVGAVVEAERDDAGGRGVQDQRLVEALGQPGVARLQVAADRRQGQVEQEHLHDERGAAEERDVEAGHAVRHRVAGDPRERPEERHHDGEHDAADRDEHRVAEPAEDVAEVVADPLQVEAGGVPHEAEHEEQHHPDGGRS